MFNLAIINLPKDQNAYNDLTALPEKYVQTINYLVAEGYMAHGSVSMNEKQNEIFFSPPYGRMFYSESALSPALNKALHDIELLDSSNRIAQLSGDGSLISKAIETIEIKKAALKESMASCESIKKALLDEEGFADIHEAFTLIDSVKTEENVAQTLHSIDPALVKLWSRNSNATSFTSKNRDSEFITWIRERNYQKALNHSATKPLSEYETNQLLSALVVNTKDILPIWQARTVETPPSGLLIFTRLPLNQWEYLMREGFNFSALDKWGGDFFAAAGLHSIEAVQLLLENGFSPNMDNLGLDAVDLLLEDSYEKGRLNPALRLILKEVDKLESNHFARIARLQKFFPAEYQKLISLDERCIPPQGTEINRFRLTRY